MKINTYCEMDSSIVELLRLGDEPIQLYAAALIEKLQAEKAALQVAVGKCTDCEIDCAKDWFKSKSNEIDDLRAENAALKRQAEQAVEDIPRKCATCLRRHGWGTCEVASFISDGDECLNWKWQGLEENHEND